MNYSKYWAVKYLDENDLATSYGYAYALEPMQPGNITTTWSGKKVLWEFPI